MIKFGDIFTASKKSSRSAYQGDCSGQFPFYTSSPKQNKFVDFFDYVGPALIIGLGGTPSIHFNENEFAVSSECLVFKPIDLTLPVKYYYYYLLANMQLLEAGFRGVGIRRITKSYINKIELPASCSYHQQLTLTLDKIYSLITLREKSISLLGELSESIFLELIGDTVINPYHWKKYPIQEIVRNITVGKRINEEFFVDKDSLIGHDYIVYEYFHTYDNSRIARKVVPGSIYESSPSFQVQANDIVICNTGQNVGKASIIPFHHHPGIINQTLIKCQVDEEIMSREVFISLINNFNFRKKNFLFREWQTPYLRLPPLKKFLKIDIPVPDLHRQSEYSEISNTVSEHNAHLNQSLVALNELFNWVLSQEVVIDNERELDELIMSYTIDDFSTRRRQSVLLEYVQNHSSAYSASFSSFEKYDKARDILFTLMKQGKIVQTFENDSVKLSQDSL